MAYHTESTVMSLAVLCLLIPFISAGTKTVLGSDPRGGFWGAYIDPMGTAATVTFPMYPEFTGQTGSVSYDPSSKQGLFELYEPPRLAYGPVCSGSRDLQPRTFLPVSTAPIDEPGLGSCVTGNVAGFTLFESRIYFLYYRECMSDTGINQLLQIRRFSTCEECGVDPTAGDSSEEFAMLFSMKCSEKVVDVFMKKTLYDDFTVPVRYELGKVLKVVTKSSREELLFYFQVGEIIEQGDSEATWTLDMVLYKATSRGQVHEMSRQRLDNSYQGWTRRMVGAVDYKDGLLCWSTIDRVWCRYDGSNHLVLQPAEALGSICKGSNTNHVTDISGIAILKNGATKSFVFGCSAQTNDTGGAGLLVKTNTSKTITALKSGEDALFGAGLSLVGQAIDDCTFVEPLLCKFQPTTVAPLPTTATTPAAEPEPELEKTTRHSNEPDVEPEVESTEQPEPSQEPETKEEPESEEEEKETEVNPKGEGEEEIDENTVEKEEESKDIIKSTKGGSSAGNIVWSWLNFFVILASVFLR